MPAPTMPTRGGGAYSSIPLANFSGGLNLASGADDPDLLDSGSAIDLLNVVFTQLGAVKQRFGYAKFTSSALTNQPDSIAGVETSSGTKRILVGNGNRLDALNTTGTSVANVATTASPHWFARIGTPSAEAVYIANGTDTVRKYVPSTDTFSTPAYTGTTPSGKYLAATYDFRLANANTATNPSRVLFSDPGAPETFGANNFVDLDPGDGEQITALVAWGSMLVAFKKSKFYVFTNTSTDSSGNPVFNFYPVRGSAGCVGGNAVAVAPDGVYFLDRRGIFKTNGKEPAKVSSTLDPFFNQNTGLYFRSLPANPAKLGNAALTFYNDRVYVALATGASLTNDHMLVFDSRYGWWSLFDIPAAAMCVFAPTTVDELLFANATVSKDVGRYSDASGYLADNLNVDTTGGTAITARWRSGWFTFYERYRGRWYPRNDVIRVRQGKMAGEGTVLVQTSKDYQAALGTGTTLTLSSVPVHWGDPGLVWGGFNYASATAQATKPKLVRHIGIRGTPLSVQFSNATLKQTFTVHRFEAQVRGPRPQSVVETTD